MFHFVLKEIYRNARIFWTFQQFIYQNGLDHAQVPLFFDPLSFSGLCFCSSLLPHPIIWGCEALLSLLLFMFPALMVPTVMNHLSSLCLWLQLGFAVPYCTSSYVHYICLFSFSQEVTIFASFRLRHRIWSPFIQSCVWINRQKPEY